jgi:hypothetical protein
MGNRLTELGSMRLLVAATVLHESGHKASPFMTLQSGGEEGPVIKLKCRSFDDAKELHSALCHFFSTNAVNHQQEEVDRE